MIRIGLTGGIASGKSTVAMLLRSMGAVVVDADELARKAVEPGSPGLRLVLQVFGPTVQASDGTLDRESLGRIVFADPERLARLNAIVHPEVRRQTNEIVALLPPASVVVFDVPLLVEGHLEALYDYVVVVDTDQDTQMARLASQRGMSPAEARQRLAAQADRDTRVAVADFILDNPGVDPADPESTRQLEVAVRRVWDRVISTDLVRAGFCWRGAPTEPTVLLVRDPDERWSLPEGHRDALEEHPSETVQRVLLEQGYDSQVDGERFASYSEPPGHGRGGTSRLVRVHLARATESALQGKRDRERRWIDAGAIPAALDEGRDPVVSAQLGRIAEQALARVRDRESWSPGVSDAGRTVAE